MKAAIRVTVEFMGPFEFEFGAAGAEIELAAPATIGTLLDAMAPRWPAARKLRAALHDASPQRRYYLVSIDYVQLPVGAALGAPLHDGARVCFGTPMVGG